MKICDKKHLKSLIGYSVTIFDNQEANSNNKEDAAEALNFLKQFPSEDFGKEFNPHGLPNFAGDFLLMASEYHDDFGDKE